MITKRIPRVLAAMLALSVVAVSGRVQAANNDAMAVKQAAMSFYSALNTMFTGDAEPMKQVWSHANDVTYMGPTGGFQVGWAQVLPQWESQAALKLGGKVEPADMRITVGNYLAVVQNWEKGENTNVGGKTQAVSIRATNVFRKENGRWKMIGHHTDLF
jgi:ketosteroid isomerase-like protein